MIKKQFHHICFVSLILFSVAGCKNNKDSTRVGVQNQVVQPKPANTIISLDTTQNLNDPILKADRDSVKPEICRLLISFYSAGEGSEFEYIRKFEDSIGLFSEKKGKNIDYEKNAWGREGETEFCLKLNEITASEQTEFINQTRELLKTARFVHVYENQACRHRRSH